MTEGTYRIIDSWAETLVVECNGVTYAVVFKNGVPSSYLATDIGSDLEPVWL